MSRPPELDLDLIRLRAEQDGLESPIGIPRSNSPPPTDEIIVRADEVDRVDEDKPQRPILRREGSAPPPPPRQPPPPAPPNQEDGQAWSGGSVGDSLSLSQLRDIVSHLPKLEPKAYAYSYTETRTLAEEIEEWFQYTEEDKSFLILAKEHFGDAITEFNAARGQQDTKGFWPDFSLEAKKDFISLLLQIAHTDDVEAGEHALLALSFLSMGPWVILEDQPQEPSEDDSKDFQPPNDKYKRFIPQLNAIKETSPLLCEIGVVEFMFSQLMELFDRAADMQWPTDEGSFQQQAAFDLQMIACLSTLYFIVLSGSQQKDPETKNAIRSSFIKLNPNPLQYLTQILARLRWEETPYIPFTRVLLLLWKIVLLVIGNSDDREEAKKALRLPEEHDKDKNETFLTASPLDYHAFRQEITSKYPAYNPPPPLVPLEINNSTMLPLSTPSLSSQASMEDLDSRHGASKSIFHQPTHIATPAPSPPPTPGGQGKGGKKQNYQTNQNFPFLYPPLDSSSNDLGGKGGAQLQDQLVGKRWSGSDIPASILEAAQLFHDRMRMSRALRQLWDAREQFVKYDRGWGVDETYSSLDIDIPTDMESEDDESVDEEDTRQEEPKEAVKLETDNAEVQARLDEIEKYYRSSFRDLQSVVIVLLKVLLSNISALGPSSTGQAGEGQPKISPLINGLDVLPKENLNLSLCLSGVGSNDAHLKTGSIEALNNIRTREITSKAISGLLLSLLKWFRLSHVLKFEYFTQLLLDSNYVPLSLKYFALQDVDKAVDSKHDRDDLSFFNTCHYLSSDQLGSHPPSSPLRPETPDSIDEAIPPPIARARPSSPTSSNSSLSSSPPPSPDSPPTPPRKPEVDELGYPTTTIPSSPLTTYAPRFFQTHITLLRILQKLTKSHAHRNLLLVQYKSSTILRKGLKIPQPELRLYTLKLFKSQVPYCGRKWRQNNMRVITAIYVFCRMGLRDEWISSGQGMVDEWVEGARDVERAWRGLCGWWHRKVYGKILNENNNNNKTESSQQEDLDDSDFFARELEKMGWSIGGLIEEAPAEDDFDDFDGDGVDADAEDGLEELVDAAAVGITRGNTHVQTQAQPQAQAQAQRSAGHYRQSQYQSQSEPDNQTQARSSNLTGNPESNGATTSNAEMSSQSTAANAHPTEAGNTPALSS